MMQRVAQRVMQRVAQEVMQRAEHVVVQTGANSGVGFLLCISLGGLLYTIQQSSKECLYQN